MFYTTKELTMSTQVVCLYSDFPGWALSEHLVFLCLLVFPCLLLIPLKFGNPLGQVLDIVLDLGTILIQTIYFPDTAYVYPRRLPLEEPF